MTTEPKPCIVKGCKAKTLHHHFELSPKGSLKTFCANDFCWTTTLFGRLIVAPRVTKSARIAALEAENAALIAGGKADAAMIASLSAKLAVEAKPPTVSVKPDPFAYKDTWVVRIDGNHEGMVFDNRPYLTFHACTPAGLSSFHATQAEAVAAIVAAWQRAQA